MSDLVINPSNRLMKVISVLRNEGEQIIDLTEAGVGNIKTSGELLDLMTRSEIEYNPDRHAILVTGKNADGSRAVGFELKPSNRDQQLPTGNFALGISAKQNKNGNEWFGYAGYEQAIKELRTKIGKITSSILTHTETPDEVRFNTEHFVPQFNSWITLVENQLNGGAIKRHVVTKATEMISSMGTVLAALKATAERAEKASSAAEAETILNEFAAMQIKIAEIFGKVANSEEAKAFEVAETSEVAEVVETVIETVKPTEVAEDTWKDEEDDSDNDDIEEEDYEDEEDEEDEYDDDEDEEEEKPTQQSPIVFRKKSDDRF